MTSQPKDLNRNPRCELSDFRPSTLPNARLGVAARKGDQTRETGGNVRRPKSYLNSASL